MLEFEIAPFRINPDLPPWRALSTNEGSRVGQLRQILYLRLPLPTLSQPSAIPLNHEIDDKDLSMVYLRQLGDNITSLKTATLLLPLPLGEHSHNPFPLTVRLPPLHSLLLRPPSLH